MNLTVMESAILMGADIVSAATAFLVRRITGVSIDSRTVTGGDLFFAISGEKNDGADFIDEAYKKGSPAAVVGKEQRSRLKDGMSYLIVDDSAQALQNLAKELRKMHSSLKVIGITGSAGKTTAKEMVYSLLKDSFRTARTEGNLNNLYGLPLCLCRLKGDEELFIAEMGMSFSGELTRLVEIADPDIGVLLNIHPVHTVNFPSMEELAQAKAELFRTMRRDGLVVYNRDNEWCSRIGDEYPGRRITYGLSTGGDLTAKNVHFNGFESTELSLLIEEKSFVIKIPRFGLGNVYNFLAAASVAYACGVDAGELEERIKNMTHMSGRGNVYKLKENITVLDDSYNSNPVAMEMLLGFLERYRADGRKVVVAGDMLELGRMELEEHFRIGKVIAKSDVDLLITVGQLSRKMIEGALDEGMKETNLLHFDNSTEAADKISNLIHENDLILVKGSHGVHTELIVEKLKKSFE